MPPQTPSSPDQTPLDFAVMRRFIPYLWPKDMPGLRLRIVIALTLVLVSKSAHCLNDILFRQRAGVDAWFSVLAADLYVESAPGWMADISARGKGDGLCQSDVPHASDSATFMSVT